MTPEITVSIVSYNTRELLRECLQSLETLRAELNDDLNAELPLQIIVADNDSRDGSLPMAQREFPNVEAFATGGNLGFGRAHNLAFERARAPYFLILNSDAILSGTDLLILRDFLRDNARVAAVAPQLFYPGGAPQFSHGTDPVVSDVFWQQTFLGVLRDRILQARKSTRSAQAENASITENASTTENAISASGVVAIEVEWVPGACVLLRSEAFDAIGGFDARFWMYVEDVDLNVRLRRAGWKIMLIPGAKAVHRLGASSGNWRARARMVAAFNRSQMIFFGSQGTTRERERGVRFVKRWTLFGAALRLAIWTPLAPFRQSARDKIRIFRQVLRATWRMKL